MEQTTVSKLGTNNLKNFVRHLCRVTKRQEDRELAKARLKQQFQNVKRVSSAKVTKRWVIDEQLKKLEARTADVLTKELEILRMGKADSSVIKGLKDKIQSLESQLEQEKDRKDFESQENKFRTEKLAHALTEIREKVGKITQEQEDKKAKRDVIKGKVSEMEKKHSEMKKSGKFSREHINRIEDKIYLLKHKV
tara:strand:- start:501 stop:1082 length:582 start_codon:yes stop_codon:yes gene_type:complete